MWKKAMWVGVPREEIEEKKIYQGDMNGRFAYYRLEIELEEAGEAIVDLSANSRYRLWINEKPVLSGPCRSNQFRHYYETVDLKPYLKKGKNILAAQVLLYDSMYTAGWQDQRAPLVSVASLPAGHRFALEGAVKDAQSVDAAELTTGKADWRVWLDNTFYLYKEGAVDTNLGALAEKIDFSDLLNLLCTVPGDYQIRFMTSHPKDASRKLIDTIAAQEHLCKHIHLPVQSGSDRLLKEMNRHYTVAQYMDLVDYAREKIPGVTFSSDIIVGFPGETEEDFQATLDLVRKVGYMQLFTFIYSKRTGTPAAKFDDPTTHAEKAARMERLLKTQDKFAFAATAAMAGQTVRVLVEAAGRTAGTVNGRLDNNLVVEFQAPESLIGQWANVHLTGSRAALLVGELVQD